MRNDAVAGVFRQDNSRGNSTNTRLGVAETENSMNVPEDPPPYDPMSNDVSVYIPVENDELPPPYTETMPPSYEASERQKAFSEGTVISFEESNQGRPLLESIPVTTETGAVLTE